MKDNINESQYKVDFSHLGKKRPLGVSGIMRVKNDAEFLQTSIESCIDALDELIIVYNDCSDASPDIIKLMQKKYPHKIKHYEYLPKIFSIGLSETEYDFARSLPEDSVNLLANYYNFALSKATFRYAMKIDADQIYFTKSLKDLLDAYRGSLRVKINLKDLFSFLTVIISFITDRIISKPNIRHNYARNYDGYKNFLTWIIKWFKIPISLSGINVFYQTYWYVTAGDINEELNILPPYNGLGDHIVFKITKRSKYKPIVKPNYNIMTSSKYSIIEQFYGVSKALPFGLMWFHMNGMRIKIFNKQVNNFTYKPQKFIPFKNFKDTKFSELASQIPTQMISKRIINLFNLLHTGSLQKISQNILDEYEYVENVGLRKTN